MAFLKLVGLCLSMFFGAFLCGEIPLRCPMSPRRMKYFTTVGVGLLIGVSFIVIIPEGVHTYYGAKETNGMETYKQYNTTASYLESSHSHSHEHEHQHESDVHQAHDDHDHGVSDDDHTHTVDDGHSHSHNECVDISRSSSSVGLALVSGFVVMFLVDRLGGGEEGHAHAHGGDANENDSHSHHHHDGHADDDYDHSINVGGVDSHSHSHSHTQPIGNHEARRSESPHSNTSVSSSSSPMDECKQLRISSRIVEPIHTPLAAPQFDQTATIGILVHSAIDGLALGAISVSDNSSLELVVFFAIILHKAPAAFGLTSFLLHQGRTHTEVRKHLLWFSLAAPAMSLATYVSFGYYNALAGSNSLSASSPDGQALLGLCLLFSAGTFLFTIAVHILPEIQQGGSHQHTEWPMVGCLIAGILGPLAFTGHNHGH